MLTGAPLTARLGDFLTISGKLLAGKPTFPLFGKSWAHRKVGVSIAKKIADARDLRRLQ